MTKLEQIIEYLDSPEGERDGLNNKQVGQRFDCSEAHVRRAHAVIEARKHAEQQSDDPSETGRLLANIISTARAEEQIRDALADLNAERKVLREELTELQTKSRAAISAASEVHPLFDKPKAEKTKKPSLAAVG